MIMRNEDVNIGKDARGGNSSMPRGQQMISAGERWLLICEKAYHRVQMRGFVGGDPVKDWQEAEREVDARYDTDFRGGLEETDAEKLTEQVKGLFGGYGLGHLGLDAILEQHRRGLERLAAHNCKLIDSTTELATRQTALFQNAVSDAMESMQSFSQGKVSADSFARQAELSTKAIENVLSYFKALTVSAGAVNKRQAPKKRGEDDH